MQYKDAGQPRLEVWQRGPVQDIPALLQPVAHALLQAREELNDMMAGFPDSLLWERPAGVASPGFHLQHLSGVLDRVFTYARAGSLSGSQLDSLKAEDLSQQGELTTVMLTDLFSKRVDACLVQLKETQELILTDWRGIGRQQLPSTVLGLLFHGAEHTMRHLGQLMVTVKVLTANVKMEPSLPHK